MVNDCAVSCWSLSSSIFDISLVTTYLFGYFFICYHNNEQQQSFIIQQTKTFLVVIIMKGTRNTYIAINIMSLVSGNLRTCCWFTDAPQKWELCEKSRGELCNLNCSSKSGLNLECIHTLSFFAWYSIYYGNLRDIAKRVFWNAEMIRYVRNAHCILIIIIKSRDSISINLISI